VWSSEFYYDQKNLASKLCVSGYPFGRSWIPTRIHFVVELCRPAVGRWIWTTAGSHPAAWWPVSEPICQPCCFRWWDSM
jgi:hypothetical protein